MLYNKKNLIIAFVIFIILSFFLFFLSKKEPILEKVNEPLGIINENMVNEDEQGKTNVEKEDYISINGIQFKNLSPKKMYVNKNVGAFQKPDEYSRKIESLNVGDMVEQLGISKDGLWSIIKSNSGLQIFILTEYLSENKIEKDIEDKKENNKNENNEKPQQPQQQQSQPQQSQQQSQQQIQKPKPQQPPKPQGGIAYPSNPNSTSVNFGITFADVSFVAKAVTKGTINTGPDKALPSTGFEVLHWFEQGETFQVTGIGTNGYVRVSYNGTIGFIHNSQITR